MNKECRANAMTMRGYLVNDDAIILVNNDAVLEMMTVFQNIQRVMLVLCSIYLIFTMGPCVIPWAGAQSNTVTVSPIQTSIISAIFRLKIFIITCNFSDIVIANFQSIRLSAAVPANKQFFPDLHVTVAH